MSCWYRTSASRRRPRTEHGQQASRGANAGGASDRVGAPSSGQRGRLEQRLRVEGSADEQPRPRFRDQLRLVVDDQEGQTYFADRVVRRAGNSRDVRPGPRQERGKRSGLRLLLATTAATGGQQD